MTRIGLFVRKTIRDCSRPKLLLAFLVPYLGLTVLLSLGFTAGVRDDIHTAPLFTQEQVLLELYSQLAFVWLVTFPMVFVAILSAVIIAGEAEKGTLVILLSKPVRRWEPLLGKVVGIFLYGTLVMVAGLLIGATTIYVLSGVSADALSASIISLLPGAIVYAAFVCAFVTAVGTVVAVLTQSRLKTAILTALVPVLFFAFIFVRLLPVGDLYEDFFLYLVDLNYHFGNVYVAIQSGVGVDFNPATEQSFDFVSGVYDVGGAWEDPLLDGMASTVPLAGHVPTVVSSLMILVLSVVFLAAAVYRFENMDIS